jgi:hypothetical protein
MGARGEPPVRQHAQRRRGRAALTTRNAPRSTRPSTDAHHRHHAATVLLYALPPSADARRFLIVIVAGHRRPKNPHCRLSINWPRRPTYPSAPPLRCRCGGVEAASCSRARLSVRICRRLRHIRQTSDNNEARPLRFGCGLGPSRGQRFPLFQVQTLSTAVRGPQADAQIFCSSGPMAFLSSSRRRRSTVPSETSSSFETEPQFPAESRFSGSI